MKMLSQFGRRSRVAVVYLAAGIVVSLAACGDTTSEPTAPTTPTTGGSASSEYVITAGDYVEYVANMKSGGSIEFDAWVPENGRGDDWGKAALVEMYEGQYRGAKDAYSGLLPYKIKACEAKDCLPEPRYFVAWNQWHKVRYEWNSEGVSATVGDGRAVSAPWKRGVGAEMILVYGSKPGGPTLDGGKMKNIKVTGAKLRK